MNAERANAVKAWILGFGASLGVTPVHCFSELWQHHVGTVVHFLESGEKRIMSQQSATVAYEKALAFLNKMSTERAITEQLSPQSAATGDQFEIVKFLVALINEMRISNQELLNFHYGLDPIVFAHLSDIFRHIDDQANWDPVDLWPSVLFQGLSVDCSNESQSQSTPKLSTARTRAPRFSASQRKPSLVVRHSPLADVLSSPRVREARLLREKEREIKKYRERADLLECEKEDLEARIDKLNVELNKFCKRADQKAALAERWENELNSVKAEVDELREKLNRKQAAFHEAEKTVKDLMQSKLICEVGQSFAVTGQDVRICQPYTPMTPGGMYADYTAPSPYSRSNNYDNSATYSSGQPYTPAGGTAGGIPQHILNSGEWLAADMVVQFRSNYEDEELREQEGTVRSVDLAEGRCTIYSFEQDREVRAYFDQLLPVKPQQGDRVKVIHGDDSGVIGTLVSVDGTEAVIKTDSNDIAEIRRLEYDNSEKAGQLDVASDHNISLTKTVADLRIQNESILQKLREKSDLVEDSKRAAIAAANEREELQMMLDSLRERIREEQRDHELQLSLQVERCNGLAAQLSLEQRRIEEDQSKQKVEMTMKTVTEERDTLREEVRQLRARCSELEKQISASRSELNIEQARLTQSCNEKGRLIESLSELQDLFKQVSEEKLELQCNLAEIETALEHRVMEASRLAERVANQEKELKRVHETLIQNVKQSTTEKSNYEVQIDVLKASLQKAERELEEAKQFTMEQGSDFEMRLSSLSKDNEAAKAELAAVRESATQRENELSSQASLVEKSLALSELETKLRDADAEASRQLAAVENQKEQLEKILDGHTATISDMRSEIAEARRKMSAVEETNAELSSTVRQLKVRLDGALLERAEVDKANEQLRSRLRAADEEVCEKREELCLLSKRFEDVTAQMTRITSEYEERRREMEEKIIEVKVNAQRREQALENAQLEAALVAAEDEVRKVKGERAALEEELAIRLRSLRERAEFEKHELTSKIAVLDEKCARLTADKIAQSESAAQSEAMIHSELRRIRSEHDSLWEEARELRSAYAAVKAQIARRAEDEEKRESRYLAHIESLRNDRNEKEETIRNLSRSLLTMRKKREMEVFRKDEQISALEMEREEMLRKLEENKANLASARGNLETLSTLLAKSRDQNKEYEEQVDRYSGLAYEKEELRRQCEEMREKLDSERREKVRLVAENEDLKVRLELESKRRAELREELALSYETFHPARDIESIFSSVRESFPSTRFSIDQRSLFSVTGAAHPVPEGDDEGDRMISTAMSGASYAVNVPEAPDVQVEPFLASTPQRNTTLQQSILSRANKSSDSTSSVDSGRLRELQRRNTMNPPHMRSAYPGEISSRFSERELRESEFRDSENFVPPAIAIRHTHGSANSLRRLGGRVVSKMLASVGRDSPKPTKVPRSAKKPFAPHN
ncbi:hypothetical protein Tcan_15853 [Toxocara canis]|uniref:Uncharacterized protein n=1 Tax=Toxocara canis TaxID=6265 RepID=A0A0B2UYW8_TOXCA|nr:hypothetical protein Tcan_15853 [Toxocara canis]